MIPAHARLKGIRAEVLREKLLRESESRAASSAQKAAIKLKEKAHQLGAFVRRVATPSTTKAEMLQNLDDAMSGVAEINTGGAGDAVSNGNLAGE